MLVAIDSGNTNVVFAIFDGETLRAKWRASSDAKRTADEYAVWLTQLMALQGLKPADITGAIIANVVPAAAYNLATLCTERSEEHTSELQSLIRTSYSVFCLKQKNK